MNCWLLGVWQPLRGGIQAVFSLSTLRWAMCAPQGFLFCGVKSAPGRPLNSSSLSFDMRGILPKRRPVSWNRSSFLYIGRKRGVRLAGRGRPPGFCPAGTGASPGDGLKTTSHGRFSIIYMCANSTKSPKIKRTNRGWAEWGENGFVERERLLICRERSRSI